MRTLQDTEEDHVTGIAMIDFSNIIDGGTLAEMNRGLFKLAEQIANHRGLLVSDIYKNSKKGVPRKIVMARDEAIGVVSEQVAVRWESGDVQFRVLRNGQKPEEPWVPITVGLIGRIFGVDGTAISQSRARARRRLRGNA